MRMVAVCMVKDEEDVVEAFARHTLAVADHLVVFDHHSTDRTRHVLLQLKAAGLPLTVLTDDEFEYRQAARTTGLIRHAVRELDADWVLPLDADEFVQAESPAAFRRFFAERPPAAPHVRLPLVNFGPHPADHRAESNPVARLRHKVRRVDTGKAAVPRHLIEPAGFAMSTGNHDVSIDNVVLPFDPTPGMWLAHYPIRSGWQAALKVAQHAAQKSAGGYGAGGGHYDLHFARMLHDPQRFIAEPEAYLRGEVDDPAAYWGGELRFTAPHHDDPNRLLSGLLALLRRLSESHDRWRREAETAKRPGFFGRLFGRRPPSIAEQAERFVFRPAGATDSTSPEHLRCDVTVLSSSVEGEVFSAVVRVTNTGPAVWRSGSEVGRVNLGVQLRDASGGVVAPDYRRVPMPCDVRPGDAVDIPVTCPTPPTTAAAVGFDPVAEGVAWFGTQSATVNLRQSNG